MDNLISKALEFAAMKHEGQTRAGGKPYVLHPVSVANSVLAFKKSKNLDALINAALLHDTVEDTETTYEELERLFGGLTASLVKELTTDKEKADEIGKDKYLAQKMAGMSSYALVIKLADRLDNVQDIATAKTPEWRARYKKETEDILNYIERNRVLSGTHKKIMTKIRAKLDQVIPSQETPEKTFIEFENFISDRALMNTFNRAVIMQDNEHSYTDKVMGIIKNFPTLKNQFPILEQISRVPSKKGDNIITLNDRRIISGAEAEIYVQNIKQLADPNIRKVDDPLTNKAISEVFSLFPQMMVYQHGVGVSKYGFNMALPVDKYNTIMKYASKVFSTNYMNDKTFNVIFDRLTAVKTPFKSYMIDATKFEDFTPVQSVEETEEELLESDPEEEQLKAERSALEQLEQEDSNAVQSVLNNAIDKIKNKVTGFNYQTNSLAQGEFVTLNNDSNFGPFKKDDKDIVSKDLIDYLDRKNTGYVFGKANDGSYLLEIRANLGIGLATDRPGNTFRIYMNINANEKEVKDFAEKVLSVLKPIKPIENFTPEEKIRIRKALLNIIDPFIQFDNYKKKDSLKAYTLQSLKEEFEDYIKKNETLTTQPTTSVKEGVEISSNAKGLAAALTNPTELAKSKGNLTESYPVEFRGKTYKDAEAAYQALKSTATKDDGPNSTYNLMVDIIKAKLEQYPRLVSEITKQGGSAWILSSTHQPTKQNSVWETGGKNWFIKALNDAYVVTTQPSTQPTEETETNLSIEDKKANLRKQIEALPDNMIYGSHVTQDDVAKDIYDNQFKFNLGTSLSGTVGLTNKQGLLDLMNNLLDGKSPHRNQFGVFILAFPKSEFGETSAERRVNLETIENDMLDNYPEFAQGKIPTKFNFGYFKDGVLVTKTNLPPAGAQLDMFDNFDESSEQLRKQQEEDERREDEEDNNCTDSPFLD
jgi:guanosine-3',5'-bis(diphosphate) 3'-pyrophosphohydrolase